MYFFWLNPNLGSLAALSLFEVSIFCEDLHFISNYMFHFITSVVCVNINIDPRILPHLAHSFILKLFAVATRLGMGGFSVHFLGIRYLDYLTHVLASSAFCPFLFASWLT